MWCACLWINIFSRVISPFFLLTYFRILAELLISCPVFQKCNAISDFSIWFNLRFLKCSFLLVSKFLCLSSVHFFCIVYSVLSCFQNTFQDYFPKIKVKPSDWLLDDKTIELILRCVSFKNYILSHLEHW